MIANASDLPAETKVVTLYIGEHKFGAIVEGVGDIIRRLPVSVVPKSPGYVIGVTNLRGHIVTEVDFGSLLGIEMTADACNYAAVVRHDDFMYGFVFEKAGDVLDISTNQIEKIPDTAEVSWKSLCLGVYRTEQDLLTIVDFRHLVGQLGVSEAIS